MNVEELVAYLLTPIVQIAIIMGLAEVIKKIGIASKWIPIFDLGLGIIIGVFVYGLALGYGLMEGAVLGTALGLSACGLFSGIKNVTGGNKNEGN